MKFFLFGREIGIRSSSRLDKRLFFFSLFAGSRKESFQYSWQLFDSFSYLFFLDSDAYARRGPALYFRRGAFGFSKQRKKGPNLDRCLSLHLLAPLPYFDLSLLLIVGFDKCLLYSSTQILPTRKDDSLPI